MCRLIVMMLFFLFAAVADAEAFIPAEEFARLPAFSAPRISPDGLRLASTQTYEGKPMVLVQKLMVGEDQNQEMNYPLMPGELFISRYRWVNNDRLVLSLRASDAVRGILVSYKMLFSIGRDGKDWVPLDMTPNNDGFYRLNPEIICLLENDPEHVLGALDENPDEWLAPEVDKVNVYTGKKTRILRNNKKVYAWLSDDNGDIRIGVRYINKGGKNDVTIYYRDSNEDSWEILQKIDYFEESRLIPQGFDDEDPNILLVSNKLESGGDAEDGDEETLYMYDLTLRKITGKYVDERTKEIEALVERVVPGKEIVVESCDKEKNRYIMKLYSDISIPEYYLLDIKDQVFMKLASEYPNLQNYVLSPINKVEYEARDGLKIPAYLTIPANTQKKKIPVVVYPHGGPWAHDEWGFDNYVQFFASRGYAVFQPQFRGSTGFGTAHEEAGYGQWGLKIQDDITDGVRWLIDEGIADPERIAIVGSSFGGYAAAMGAVKTPDLYKCVVSINGILDLKYFFDKGRYLYFESINRETWNDRKDVEKTSPYHLAGNIEAPVLLIAGEKDTIVSKKHSKKMHKKLQKLKKTSQYIELENGEHWRTNEKNEITKLKALEEFLGKYL